MKLRWFMLLLLVVGELVLAQDTISPRIRQRLVAVMERFGEEPDQAIAALDRLATARSISDSDLGFVRRQQAALLIEEERNAEALSLLQSTLSGQPDTYLPALRLLLGQLLLMEGDAEGAARELQVWSEQEPDPHPVELSVLGYAYLQVERFDAAVPVFERLLAISEAENDQWYEVLAFAYVQTGRSADAIALLDSVIASKPEEARWWRQLSNIYLLLEDYQAGAANLAIAALITGLDHAESRRLAGLFSMINMPAEGAEVLAAARHTFPDDHGYDDQMLLGELWMLARETDLALNAFEEAQLLAADGEPALRIAQLHLQWERYDEAQQALRLAIQHYGENTPEEIWYLLAIVEINRDDMNAAGTAVARLDEQGEYGERRAALERYIADRGEGQGS